MMRMIPVEVVATSVDPGLGGVLRAATPTIVTPATITTSEMIWWTYYFLPRNYQAK